ncbi:MAG TPA: hypothetical protein VI756_27580 [Blastocatellia bacterium]
MEKKSMKRLWPDEAKWLDLFREIFCHDPELAEYVAHIWFAFLEQLREGPEGASNARRMLSEALGLIYPFTSSHKLVYRHYKLSLSGYVLPEDEPDQLLKASINRARASIAEARQRKRKLKD